jgi:ABC-2 type transport system ATP-binding protein
MITIKNLKFWYSKRNRIFENLNLELVAGHIYGLLGKNGAGKTTLLKLICGLSFPKSGEVTIDQQVPARREFGFLSEIFLVPEEIFTPSLSVKKFAEVYGGFYPAFDPSQFREYLGKFEVTIESNFSHLSLGQRKKAMISFALACNTRYLLLDEPTNGLDIPSKAVLRSLIAGAFSEDKTIIISTHQVRDLQSLIDSVIILENRSIILNQPLENVAQKLIFSHSLISQADGKVLFSMNSELGQAFITPNHTGIAGDVDLETLFMAAIHNPENIVSIFKY